jgi:hypothetical protein
MTARDELDRVLGEWLADGPTRAPDWPIDRAIAHARTHPRRPDPLSFMRAPVFPARVGAFNPRPALLFAAALLVALTATALVIGSRPSPTPVVVPPASTPTSTPEPSPTVAPTPTAHALSPVHVALEVAAGQPASVDIFYDGRLVEARSGQPGDGVSAAEDEIHVTNDGPNTLVLTWSGMPCETSYRLEVTPNGRDYRLVRPTCSGDAIAFDRVLLLTFGDPVPASQVSTKVQRAEATSQP